MNSKIKENKWFFFVKILQNSKQRCVHFFLALPILAIKHRGVFRRHILKEFILVRCWENISPLWISLRCTTFFPSFPCDAFYSFSSLTNNINVLFSLPYYCNIPTSVWFCWNHEICYYSSTANSCFTLLLSLHKPKNKAPPNSPHLYDKTET